jgi:predicted HicB family RNase H-like nuclease
VAPDLSFYADTALQEGTVMTGTIHLPSAERQDAAPPSTNGDRVEAIMQRAADLYQHAPDWTTFFREILGIDGLVRKSFPNPDQLAAFEQTEVYAQLQQMLAKLREKKEDPNSELEPTRVITVRLPKSLHELLKAEAHGRRTSMNKLCISKLLQMIDNELVPGD